MSTERTTLAVELLATAMSTLDQSIVGVLLPTPAWHGKAQRLTRDIVPVDGTIGSILNPVRHPSNRPLWSR